MSQQAFEVDLTYETGYRFNVRLDDGQEMTVDESPPLGRAEGPSPPRLLATAAGHCLCASLVFCLKRSHIELEALTATVEGDFVRNEAGRLRIGRLDVRLEPVVPAEDLERVGRCIEVFEDYCIVTGSIRKGIDVTVEVTPRASTRQSTASG